MSRGFQICFAIAALLGLPLAVLASTQSSAQSVTAQADPRPSPELTARIDGVVGDESKALRIAQLDVEVRRHGGLATTEMTVRFDNPSDRTLEGEFGLTLPAGSVVTGYALDVNGELIEGVLQSRDRAREAFERRVVRRIDPGLAEVDFSDRFESRVYPIFPRQGRTIRIRFASPLDADGTYRLPLDTGSIGKYTLQVRGIEPRKSGNLDWQGEGNIWRVSGAGEIDGAIAFTVPQADGLTLSEHPGEGRFFELSGTARPGDSAARGPLTILWDRSVSRLDDELEREAAMAARMAREARVDRITLYLFDSGASETRTVATRDLRETLEQVRYAGGTSYAGLPEVIASAQGTCALFSDGRAMIDDRPDIPAAGCRLVAVASGAETDRGWLEGQARKHNGALVELGVLDDAAALKAAFTSSSLPQITDTDGMAIETRALPANGGRYRLVGPMPRSGALMVNGRLVQAPSPVVPNFTGPGALWAAQHLALTRDSMPVQDLAEQARRWSVAVPGISFIVLETPDDYADAGFVPPDNYPKPLRARFDQVRQAMAERDRVLDRENYNRLLSLWENRKRWWATGKAQGDDRAKGADGMMPPPPPVPVMAPPPPPPAMAPPPPVARPQGSRPEPEEAQNIIVTGSRRATPSEDSAQAVTTVDIESAEASFDNAAPEGRPGDGRIAIVPSEWSAERAYIAEWIAAGDMWPAAVARTARELGELPLFYLDLAEWHFRAGRTEEARRAAAAALELPSRDNQTLEIVAERMLRYGDTDRAIWLLEQLIDREAERPHPVMALAQAYAERSRKTGSRDDLVKAHELMAGAALKRWPAEYQQVGEIALAEANALIVRMGGANARGVVLDPKFIAALPVDIRIAAMWNTTRTDLDLWVVEPSGEEVGYSNRYSRSSARYTQDVTNGYGPEEYLLRKAPGGTYRIEVDSFAADRRNPNGPSTVTVRLIRDFAGANQREETIDVEMQPDAEGRRLVGTIEVK